MITIGEAAPLITQSRAAIAKLKSHFEAEIPEGADVLDLCSSWVSHLPDKRCVKVTGCEARARVVDGRVLAPVWTQKSGCRIGIVALVQVRYSSWARVKRGRVEG